MSPTIAGALAGLIIGLPSTVVALYVAVQNRRSQQATNALDERREHREEEAADAAAIRQLRVDVDGLWGQLGEERRLRELAERRAADAEHRASQAEQRAAELEARVAHLEDALEVATSATPDCEGDGS